MCYYLSEERSGVHAAELYCTKMKSKPAMPKTEDELRQLSALLPILLLRRRQTAWGWVIGA